MERIELNRIINPANKTCALVSARKLKGYEN